MDAARFDYPLPAEAVAQHPVEPRSAARMLVSVGGPAGPTSHATVADLPVYLRPGDVVVVNETRVLPARLALRKPSGGAAEVMLLEPLGPEEEGRWAALVRPGRRLPPGTVLLADDGTPVIRLGSARTPLRTGASQTGGRAV
ncbi:MAG: S-adenosylmethionine:tRNA ribosyltransferase-isomerase, partial [Actinomycetota bacterium]|nr:S-adenosylmethionine:tRNA ribosyltransferase-isomerase [Actinomycetota bacterium]